jgi:hypothetical protein
MKTVEEQSSTFGGKDSRSETRRTAQHALPPDAAPLRFAAQVKRGPLGGPTNSESRESMEGSMATVAQMTKDELREMIETIIEQKLLELVGDPDEGLPLRKTIRNRLLRQKEAVARGERGEPFEEVVQRLGLE